MRTKEHAMECYPANAVGWGQVIQLLWMILIEGDLERLARYCNNYPSRHFDCPHDYALYKNWKGVFVGERKYHMIRYVISGMHTKMKGRRKILTIVSKWMITPVRSILKRFINGMLIWRGYCSIQWKRSVSFNLRYVLCLFRLFSC